MTTKSAARRRGGLGRGALAAVACVVMPACLTFHHTVGRGPMSAKHEVVVERQWHALFGLLPVSPVDSGTLAGGAKDYRVTTRFTFVDVVISTFTSFASFYRQTIFVEK